MMYEKKLNVLISHSEKLIKLRKYINIQISILFFKIKKNAATGRLPVE